MPALSLPNGANSLPPDLVHSVLHACPRPLPEKRCCPRRKAREQAGVRWTRARLRPPAPRRSDQAAGVVQDDLPVDGRRRGGPAGRRELPQQAGPPPLPARLHSGCDSPEAPLACAVPPSDPHAEPNAGGRSVGPKDANDALVLRVKKEAEHSRQRAALEARLAAAPGGVESERAEEELARLDAAFAEEADALDLNRMLAEARSVKHEHIVTFADLREQVKMHLLGHREAAGMPFGESLPSLTGLLKGHRPGELTIFTGRTGQGKTSVCSQLSLDLAEQGIHTLWGSFEVKNILLVSKMLQQHAREGLANCSEGAFEAASETFQELPLWFLSYYGSTKLDDVLSAMEYAAYQFDVRHVVLDNLQFMTSSTQGRDLFSALDNSIHRLRHFATDYNVHITLVIHPRKDDESQLLTLSSVFGSAKATQESDNVIILQNNGLIKYLDIRKNRYDGTLGFVPLDFDRATLRFREMTPDELRNVEERQEF